VFAALVSLVGCKQTPCTGNIVSKTERRPGIMQLRVHTGAGTGNNAEFCIIDDTTERLAGCDVGDAYPKCSK
jgi:hypothetical protein